jgi:putative heme-binding domain-containing protein
MQQWAVVPMACLVMATLTAAQAPVPKPLAQPTAADLTRGAKLFAGYCSRCHGADGTGGMGPPLARPRLRRATDDAGIIDILMNGVPGTNMAAAFWLSEREIVQVAAYVRSLGQRPEEALPGDPAVGRDIYARAGCATCHMLTGEGTGIGPDLSDVGAQRGASFLRQSLIDPAAARPERPIPYEPYSYQAYLIVRAQPRSGQEITGIRLNEDAFTIQIRDQQGLHSLRKRDLERLVPQPGTSLMPSYRDTLKGRELEDLVAFLMTRQGAR